MIEAKDLDDALQTTRWLVDDGVERGRRLQARVDVSAVPPRSEHPVEGDGDRRQRREEEDPGERALRRASRHEDVDRRSDPRELGDRVAFPGLERRPRGRIGAHAGGEDLDRRVQLDVYYIRRRSFLFDLWILARTPWAVLHGRGAM